MQTVQFSCSHCSKAMAVGVEHAGKAVRCPHCQQVVTAPAAAVPNPPVASFSPDVPSPPEPSPAPAETLATSPGVNLPGFVFTPPPSPTEAESIFAPPEEHTDDLFGEAAPPRLELPPMPSPTVEGEPPTLLASPGEPVDNGAVPAGTARIADPYPPVVPPPPADPGTELQSDELDPEATVADVPDPFLAGTSPEAAPTAPAGEPASAGEMPWMTPAAAGSAVASVAATDELAATRAARRTTSQSDWYVPLAILPLFGLIASLGLNFWLIYWEMPRRARITIDRLEALPDVGDVPGARKNLNSALDTSDPKLAFAPLPERLTTTLGQPLRVGDLEVTPRSVELRVVNVYVEGSARPEPCPGPSLVLNLRLRNLAPDYAFTPLDNYFDRHYERGVQVPLTQVEVGNRDRLLGGPARWYPRFRDSRDRNYREWVEGRKDLDLVGLKPGESVDTIVCTDWRKVDSANPDRPRRVEEIVERYEGPYLWRVHVRRGLVRFQHIERSATALIGVRFTDKDIEKNPG
jgi:hypothetical protein